MINIDLNNDIKKFTLKTFSNKLIIINLFFIFLVLGLWVFYQNIVYTKFANQYYLKTVKHLSLQLSLTAETNKAGVESVIRKNLQDKWIKNIWVTDSDGILISHSSKRILNKYLKLKFTLYGDINKKLWKFDSNGDVIPSLTKNLKYNSIDTVFPVYENNQIKFFCGIRFSRFVITPFLLPQIDIPIYFYLIEVVFISLFIFLLFIIVNIIVFSKITNREEKLLRDSIATLYKIPIDDIEYKIEIDEKYKKNILAEYLKFINYILEYYHTRIKNLIEKDIKLRKITPPLLFTDDADSTRIEPVKIVVKPTEQDINKYLSELYYNEKNLQPIKNFSYDIYHFFNDYKNDIILKFINILGNRKAFFLLDISDEKNKRFLLEFLNYYLQNKKKGISNSDGYLTELNNFLNRFGDSELWFHSMYLILDTETNYIEMCSTKFSPVILFKAEEKEAYYYEFEGVPVGKRTSENFQKNLKKEVFRLSAGDIILIMNKEFENLKNYDGIKFEMYKIIDVLKDNPDTSAEVLREKIVNKMIDFGIDFSKTNELFLLILKRN